MSEYFRQLTSKQRDEHIYLMDKAHEEFLYSRIDRTINSIGLNRSYKFSNESWYEFILRIKRRINNVYGACY